ncbi:MAG: glycosyltransferase [Cyanosarcina radialis HA8281-LM2]|jgi:glycosyltransferase involved in cell wall biosynthesis|nr:glycosyltransferase [Cyanosarcina radialis HA8281-LM2]
MPKPVVVLFSSLLLPPSQTFIRAQGEQLQEFTPYYVGSRLIPGLSLPPERTVVVNRGGIWGATQEVLFKVSGFAPNLYRQVRQLQPALIHAQFGLSGALALPLARDLKVPLVVHFRGADATVKEEYARNASINHRVYFRRREALKRETRLFITVCQFLKNKLLEQGFPGEKILVHYHGVNVEAFQPDESIPREPVVLFVGRLTEKKGCEDLIQAMSQVQAVMPDRELVLIGDGPLKPKLETLASQVLRRYRFLGLQSQAEVKNWMNRASLLVTPSITAADGDAEGLPNVVLEAQAMGLPVVATKHAGIPEAVVDGETGFLVEESDREGLAVSSLRLLQDTDLWQHFSANGKERVRNGFDRSKQTQILEEIYQKIWRGEQ